MLQSVLASFLVPLINLWSHGHPDPRQQQQQQPAPLFFELRHFHAVSSDARVVFSDVSPSQIQALGSYTNTSYSIQQTVPLTTYKPPSLNALLDARKSNWDPLNQNAAINWEEDVVIGPNVESRETLLLLAKMTNDAYLNPGEAGWYELGKNWTVVSP